MNEFRTGPYTVGGYSSGCYRCGHTKGEHDPD